MGNIRYRYDTPVGGVRPVAMDYARYYGGGGLKRDKNYNTILTPEQEREYAAWVETLPLNLRSDYDYDLRGAWLNGDLPDENYHMTDKWKKPWHATFSDESVYSGDGVVGGHWYGDNFEPSALNRYVGGFRYGSWGANSFGDGGGIHIKKENRGKFTAAAERAGKSVQAYASQILANKGNYSPTLVKRANFARNAAKWHGYGGNLYEAGGGKDYPWHPPMSAYNINGTQPAGTAMPNPYAVRKSQPVAWSGLMRQLNTSLAASTGAYVPMIPTGVPSYSKYINNSKAMTKSGDPVAYQRNRLHYVENQANTGYDPVKQRYVAYDSVEGGEQTVGDGLKLYPNEAWTKLYNRQGYLTKQQHDDFVNARIRKDIEATRRFYDATNNDAGAFDRLSPEMQAWLIDYNYNPGITRFPKLVKAVYADDRDTVRRESGRMVNGKPLGRNKIMINDLDRIYAGDYTGEYGE